MIFNTIEPVFNPLQEEQSLQVLSHLARLAGRSSAEKIHRLVQSSGVFIASLNAKEKEADGFEEALFAFTWICWNIRRF